jgi:hypothetical protein
MEDDGIFNGHFVQITVFCCFLWTFGLVCGNLVHFPPFGYFVQRKIWQPCLVIEMAFTDVTRAGIFCSVVELCL